MLLGNGFTRYGSLNKQFGGTSISGSNMATVEGYRLRASTRRNIFAGEAGMAGVASVPNGARHPMVWLMPIKTGGLTSGGSIVGSGGASASAQSGYNIEAALTGSGDIPNTVSIGLIVSIAAALTASGGITNAQTQALASIVASITGSGSVAATAAGLARIAANIAGSGVITANNTALMSIAATIRGYGDLTPEGIRDSVWNAILANYPNAGTAGKALSTAGSGGVDINALVAAILAGAAADPIAANIKEVNDYTVTGNGQTGTEWGPV